MKAEKLLMRIQQKCMIRNGTVKETLAEALGTFVMMCFGLGGVAQAVLGKKEFGQYLSINLAFGFGVTMGIHVAGGISGAHMNTAVSFTNCVLGYLPWRKLPFYALGQFIGSFLAAALVYCVYYEALHSYCGGNLTVTGPCATAGIFATYPAAYMTSGGGFLCEFVATAILLVCILAINDKKNCAALDGTQAIVVGILVILIGITMGMNTGYAINPARDLPPRIFTAIAGWGVEVFRAGNYWCWIPIVAPMTGGITGAFIYKLVIALHNQSVEEDVKYEDTKEHLDIAVIM